MKYRQKDDLRQIKRKASSLYNLSGSELNNDVACILRLDTKILMIKFTKGYNHATSNKVYSS